MLAIPLTPESRMTSPPLHREIQQFCIPQDLARHRPEEDLACLCSISDLGQDDCTIACPCNAVSEERL